eukprot:9048642-Alexandrium_andersonii.AAC.1
MWQYIVNSLPPAGPSVRKLLHKALGGASPGKATAPLVPLDWRLQRERPHRGGCRPPAPPKKCIRRAGGAFWGGVR